MAELFLARDRNLGRKVVIKVLSPILIQRKDFQNRFKREARIQAKLDNPHIVQVFGLVSWEGSLCLVMQHVEGTDLEKIIRTARSLKEEKGQQGALSAERAVHIFLQILEGIGFAHKYGIIHGDIKPSNVLLDRQGRVKVADFGQAFAARHKDAAPQGGTPHYMSPEQILDRKVDARSDIYALGVSLFHMITGRLPHGDKKGFHDLIEWHMEGAMEEARAILEASQRVPVHVRDAILKALEQKPDRRHQSCLEFALAIREESGHEMYSELLRLSLLTRHALLPSERAYLDRIAEKKGLSFEEARILEKKIRAEMGLSPVDFEGEYRLGLADDLRWGGEVISDRLDRLYIGTGRITEKEALKIRDELTTETGSRIRKRS